MKLKLKKGNGSTPINPAKPATKPTSPVVAGFEDGTGVRGRKRGIKNMSTRHKGAIAEAQATRAKLRRERADKAFMYKSYRIFKSDAHNFVIEKKKKTEEGETTWGDTGYAPNFAWAVSMLRSRCIDDKVAVGSTLKELIEAIKKGDNEILARVEAFLNGEEKMIAEEEA